MLIYGHLTTRSVSVYFLAADSGYQGKSRTSGLLGRRISSDSSIHVRNMKQKSRAKSRKRWRDEISYS